MRSIQSTPSPITTVGLLPHDNSILANQHPGSLFYAQVYSGLLHNKKCVPREKHIDLKTEHVRFAWKQELSNQYTQSFHVKAILSFQTKLNHIMSKMTHVKQHIIDTLYTDMKTMFYSSQVYINNIHLILAIITEELGDSKNHSSVLNASYYTLTIINERCQN